MGENADGKLIENSQNQNILMYNDTTIVFGKFDRFRNELLKIADDKTIF